MSYNYSSLFPAASYFYIYRTEHNIYCGIMPAIRRVSFVLALSLLLAAVPIDVASVSPLKFLLMVASGSSQDSSAVVSAVNQTLEEINTDASILPGHRLEYILRDTEVYTVKLYTVVELSLSYPNILLCVTLSARTQKHLTVTSRWLLTAQWWQWWGVAAPLLLRRWPKSVTTQTYRWWVFTTGC